MTCPVSPMRPPDDQVCAEAPIPWWWPTTSWAVNCSDDIDENGYLDRGVCVPGLVTREAWYTGGPGMFWGQADAYAPGVMERVAKYRGIDLGDYVDGVALMSCADLWHTVSVRGPYGWEGPFIVVDCSARRHMIGNVLVRELVVEVGARTSERWGGNAWWVQVRVSGYSWSPEVWYPAWWRRWMALEPYGIIEADACLGSVEGFC